MRTTLGWISALFLLTSASLPVRGAEASSPPPTVTPAPAASPAETAEEAAETDESPSPGRTTRDNEPQPPVSQAGPDAASARAREFEGSDVGTVLRLLARQARINLVISDLVLEEKSTITIRLEDVTAFDAIKIICQSKSYLFLQHDNVYYVKHPRERLRDMHYLDSEKLAKALADFRVRQLKELLAGGFSRTEAMELLKLDHLTPEKLYFRGAPALDDAPARSTAAQATTESAWAWLSWLVLAHAALAGLALVRWGEREAPRSETRFPYLAIIVLLPLAGGILYLFLRSAQPLAQPPPLRTI